MTSVITSAVDIIVGDVPVRLVSAVEERIAINVASGASDLWWGDKSVRPGTVEGRIPAGASVEILRNAEIWVVRNSGNQAACGYKEEFSS